LTERSVYLKVLILESTPNKHLKEETMIYMGLVLLAKLVVVPILFH